MFKKILVVDDSESSRESVKNFLGGDYDFVEAIDGLDALNKLKEVKDLDLLILDVNMPGLNGIQVVEEMAKDEEIKTVFTIILTTEATFLMKEAVKKHRFVRCWIIKPVTADLLSGAVKKIFKE